MLRRLLVPVALAGMVTCAGLALGRVYAGMLLPELVAGAAVGAVLLSVLARRLPAWTAGPLSVAGLFGYALFAVRYSAAAADIPGDLATVAADAARNGIPRLLTALIPVEPQPDTVLIPVVAAWLAGLAGAELAVRGGRVLLGYAAPAACYAAALYLVGPNAAPALGPTLGFAGLAALGLAASGRRGPSRSSFAEPAAPPGENEQAGSVAANPNRTALRIRSALGAATALAVIGALAVAVGPVVADRVDRSPEDPRRLVVPPQLDALDENPLIRLSGWAVTPTQHLFDATVDRDSRVRLAVLNDYDGVTWRVGATYRSAGRSLPRSEEARITDGMPTETVVQRITIADLSGHLLPAIATPQRVDGVRVAYDTASGTLARPDGLDPGIEYEVTSQRPKVDVNLLPSAEVPAGPSVARMLFVPPGLPEEIERLAKQLAEGNAGPYQRASAIESFLAEHYELAADAPSGHAYPNLGFFLFGARNAGGQRGTSEQFAAAFAILARATGLPTRVVVGFQVRAGRKRVTAADALAWPEVLFNGVGWVPFHPLPQPDQDPRPVEDDFKPQPPPSEPPPSAAPTVSVSVPPPSPPASAAAAPGNRASFSWAAVAITLSGLVVLCVIGYLVTVPLLRRAQRRRRLDRGPPDERVAGAWLEVSDALRLAGRPADENLAASEVAEYAAAAAGLPRSAHRRRRVRLPAPPIDELAAVVNATVFGPGSPGEADVRRARSQAVAYVDELRARRSRLRRLLWTLNPGPLRWRRRR